MVGDRWKLVTKLALNAPSVSSPESYRGSRDPCIAHYGRHISRSAFHYELSKHEWSSSVFTWNRIRCFAFRLPLFPIFVSWKQKQLRLLRRLFFEGAAKFRPTLLPSSSSSYSPWLMILSSMITHCVPKNKREKPWKCQHWTWPG